MQQPRYGSNKVPVNRWVDKEYVVYIYNEILLGHKKRNLTICDSIDRLREFYAKWNKSENDKKHMISPRAK